MDEMADAVGSDRRDDTLVAMDPSTRQSAQANGTLIFVSAGIQERS